MVLQPINRTCYPTDSRIRGQGIFGKFPLGVYGGGGWEIYGLQVQVGDADPLGRFQNLGAENLDNFCNNVTENFLNTKFDLT